MQDVTAYAPIRIFLTGLWRVLFGGLFLLLAVVLLYAIAHTPSAAPSAADPPSWLMAVVPVGLSLVGAMAIAPGIGRIVSAFSQNCYLHGGADGVALRFPIFGWFGRFRVRTFNLGWNDIEKLVEFTYRINNIPTNHELRIYLRSGHRIYVERCFFSSQSATIQRRLLEIRARAAL